MEFANVPHDASERMPDEEMAKLELTAFLKLKPLQCPISRALIRVNMIMKTDSFTPVVKGSGWPWGRQAPPDSKFRVYDR